MALTSELSQKNALALRRISASWRAGERAANVMSLIQSAKLNGHDPYRYLKDVLERLPTQPATRLEELLPHRWQLSPVH
jgi:transposase